MEGLGAGILDWLVAGEIDVAVLYRPILPLASVADGVAQGKLRTAVLTGPPVEREVVIATPQNRPVPSDFLQIMRTLKRIMSDTITRGDWPGAELL